MTIAEHRRPVPWRRGAAMVFTALQVLALAAVAGGWHAASHRADPFEQVPWLVVAALGTVASAFAGLLLLLDARRAIGVRVRVVTASIAERADRRTTRSAT